MSDIQERIELLGPKRVAATLRMRHGMPGLSGIMATAVLTNTRPSDLKEHPPRFDRSYWFAKPPDGTPWPTAYMHHTFETCWLSQHDMSIGNVMHLQISSLPQHAQMLMIWQTCGIQWWIDNNGVTVFPEDHLVEACANTEVLDCVTGSDIHASLPHMMFGLSEKTRIANAKGDDWINYVLVSFVDNGKEEKCKLGEGTLGIRMPPECPRYVIVNSFWKSGFVSSFAIPLREHVPLKSVIAEFSEKFIDDEFRQHTLTPDQLAAEHDETAEVGKYITAMVFNLCLLMQSYPEYVFKQPEKHNRRLCLRKQPPPSTFRLNDRTAPVKPPPVHEGPKTADEEITGDRPTKKAHWRRGHWRRQPHTADWEVANPDVKVVLFSDGRRAHMVWIKPIYVSGNRGAAT